MSKVCKRCTMTQILDAGDTFVCPNPEAQFCGAGVQLNPIVRKLVDFCCDPPVPEKEEEVIFREAAFKEVNPT